MNLLDLARLAITTDDDVAPTTKATPDQATELRRLVRIVAANWPGEEQAETLAVALADPVDALTCFRALVAERIGNNEKAMGMLGSLAVPIAVSTEQCDAPPDMRTCRQCTNLSPGGRCLAAWRGELPGFARSYGPAMTERPQRCAGYAPGADDPDRRTGRERWPWITPKETTA